MVASTPPYPGADSLWATEIPCPSTRAEREGSPAPAGEFDPAALTLFIIDAERSAPATPVHGENLLCRLAACTAAGAHVCNKGCGLSAPSSGAAAALQTCPFGLASVPVGALASGGQLWLGRRFTSIGALHRALDQLAAAGIPEEVILDHLPPNPIFDAAELQSEVERCIHELQAGGHLLDESPAAHGTSARRPVSDAEAADALANQMAIDQRLGNLLEYLAQIHSLMGSARKAETVCDRFLRALAGALPFSEMEVFLRADASAEAEFVICASVDHKPARTERPLAQRCRLEAGDLGHEVVRRGIPLLQRADVLETLNGPAEAPDAAAYPLVARGGDLLGVWVARHRSGVPGCTGVIGREWARFMSLLAGMLTSTLEGLQPSAAATAQQPATAQPAAPAPETPAAAAPPVKLVTAALSEECARSARSGQPFALARLLIEFKKPHVQIDPLQLELALRENLRPFDTLIRDPNALTEGRLGWWIMLPGAGEEQAGPALLRLSTLCEDVLDSVGGLEELGARVGVGVTLWGNDAVQPDPLIEHAMLAAQHALQSATGEGPVRFRGLGDLAAEA